jgi:hypothetical protein
MPPSMQFANMIKKRLRYEDNERQGYDERSPDELGSFMNSLEWMKEQRVGRCSLRQ